ncbi:MAG: BrnA antitoxin family protein [Chlorobium sp.]|nr:BrnA antitoxin family protein [Chlorobium sp.]
MTKEYDFSNGKRGPVIQQQGKSRITIYLDNDVLDEFRERADNSGSGYQTMINEALREYLNKKQEPINEAVLRKVVREELEKIALH